jgi:2,3-dimethylmalate lyase
MLKKLLEAGEPLIVPGVYDALSAVIAEQAGFKVLYVSGFAVSGSLLGQPDIGLITASEMIGRVSQISAAVSHVPVIADGDNGYGDEAGVAKLVNAYEQAGVQCIQLEDQVSPKRCGHMDNKEVVSLEEARSKIAAAVAARNSSDFLIMARTDARATHNLDEALRRAEAFLEAGADILFVEAPASFEEMEVIKNRFPSTFLVANMVEEGKTPERGIDELHQAGFQIVLRPISALLSVARTLQQSYSDLADFGRLQDTNARLSFQQYNKVVGEEST